MGFFSQLINLFSCDAKLWLIHSYMGEYLGLDKKDLEMVEAECVIE
jgi:hypothetical protein